VTIQPIRLFGDPVLRTRAEEVVEFGKELRVLVRDLWDTMESEGGAGIAAPQLGVGLRVFTYHCDGFAGHMVNPTWTAVDEDCQDGEEGCLSIPGLRWETRRMRNVVATGWNMYGEPIEIEGTDLLARCIQHETDHLDGVLFVDRLDQDTRKQAMKQIREAPWFNGTVPTIKQDPHVLFGGH
jgi:peptide deformylase